MADGQFDIVLQKQIQEYAEHLRGTYAARNEMFERMEEMILMVWPDEAKVKSVMQNVKVTKSPDARNALMGALRLLVATDPVFNVPSDENHPIEAASEIEKWCTGVWKAAGRIRQDPVHYDVVLSMLAFSEVHLAITKTEDLVEHAQGANPAALAKAEEMAALTPYVFDVWDPRTGYPDIGPYGLRAFYREVSTLSGNVLDDFGDAARAVLDPSKRYDQLILCNFWDYENRYIWVQGKDQPLVQEKHGLPFIPIVVQLGEGGRLFSKPEHQRQPFLYTLWKSGLWDRQNLSLTVLYTMLFAFGSNPIFTFTSPDPERQLEVDWSKPGGVAKLLAGESFQPVSRQIVSPEMWRSLEIAERKVEESTIYGQTLGEPLGQNAPFSMVALLHQAGRLPLMAPQRKSGWGIADALKIGLKWMKKDGKKSEVRYGQEYIKLEASRIPDQFELEADLDVALPTDRLQEANVARYLTEGEDPLVSHAWVLENVLNIGQPEDMKKEIWSERAATVLFQQFMSDMMAQAQARQQEMQQQAMGRAMEGVPEGAPQMPQSSGPLPGRPGEALPPEMMEGGGQPPMMPGEEGMM